MFEFLKPYDVWVAPLAGMMSGLAGLVVAILAFFRTNREVRQRQDELETLKRTMAHTDETVLSLKTQTETLQKMAQSHRANSETTAATIKEQADAFRQVVNVLEKLTKDSEERVVNSHNALTANMDAKFKSHEQATTKMIEEIVGQIQLDQKERAQSKLIMLRNQREMLESQQRVAEVQRDTIAHGMNDLRHGASPHDVRLQLKEHLDAELSRMPVDPGAAEVIRTGIDELDALLAPVLDPIFSALGSLLNLGENANDKDRQHLEGKLQERKDLLEESISQLQARRNELAAEMTTIEKASLEATKELLPVFQARQVTVGAKVQARWKMGSKFYPGTITDVQGDKLHIHYEDGDQEWTTLAALEDGIHAAKGTASIA